MSERNYDLGKIVKMIMDSPAGMTLVEINVAAGKKTKSNNDGVINAISSTGIPILKEDNRYYIFRPEPEPSMKYIPPVRERLPGEPLIRHILRNGIGGNDIELLKGGFYGI